MRRHFESSAWETPPVPEWQRLSEECRLRGACSPVARGTFMNKGNDRNAAVGDGSHTGDWIVPARQT